MFGSTVTGTPKGRRALSLSLALALAAVTVTSVGAEASPLPEVDVAEGLPPTVAPALTTITGERFADTRPGYSTIDGLFAGDGPLAARTEYEVTIAGRGSVPGGAVAAVINATALDPDGPGFFTIYECDPARPNASALNYTSGVDIANEIVVKLSAVGSVCVYTLAGAGVLLDVVGYIDSSDSTKTMTPKRFAESREGFTTFDGLFEGFGRTSPASTTTIQIANRGGLPATIGAAIVNVGVVDPTDDGFVTVFSCQASVPSASSINYTQDVTRANELIVQPNAGGEICIYTLHDVDLIVDVVGYVETGSDLDSSPNARYFESRPGMSTFDGQQQGGGILAAGSTTTLKIGGRGTVPANAAAVIANVAAVDPSAAGHLRVFPCTDAKPNASSLIYAAGVTGANELISALDANGELCVFTSASTHLIVDVVGFIELKAGLSITKSDDIDPILAGETLTYTVEVTNDGPDTATDVVVTDTLPVEVSLVSTSGCAEDPNGVPTCTLGDLAAGASASYTIEVTVNGGTSGIITNAASVTSATDDPYLTNNSVDEETTVLAPATIIVEKQTDPDGETGTFTFTGDAAGSISDDGTITVSGLAPGTYTSTESSSTPGFDLAEILCDDGNSTVSVASRTATFNVEAGETVTCTFTNKLSPTVTSLSPTMVDSEIPTTVTITGTGFESASGTANVTLAASAGTPFALGTQPSLTVLGTIVNPTTITFTSPISGVLADLNADVTVDFPGGASATSAAALLIKTPTVVASSLATVPSEIPTLITITVTGFAGGTPTVRFVAAAGTPFLGGTASTVTATGVTLINPTTIIVTTPRAGVGVDSATKIEVSLTGGLTPISSGNLITFEPPTVTSLSPTMVDSEIPQVVTITGTGFGSSSGLANVTLSGAGTPFALGTVSSLTVLGTVVNPTTITFTSPISGVQVDLNADVTVSFATGASATRAGSPSIKTPTVTASSLANVPSEIPTLITITGTGFAGGTPTVKFVAATGTPFSGGTASTVEGTGVTLINPTTITVTTPRAGVGVCSATKIEVSLTGGLKPISSGDLVTFEPPTLASLSPTMVDSEIPQVVTITGTGFGSASGLANVTLSGAGTPFSLGTQPSLTVAGTVVNPTTITFTSPISGVLADLNADVTVKFATNASATSAAALLIKTPTVVASSLASVPSEIPTLITITGTGFAGGTPTVRFVAATGTPFSGGTASTVAATGVTLVDATTITVTTPRAGVGVSAGARIEVSLSGGLKPISAGDLVTFEPPTVASLSPTMVDSEIPQVVTITGTGFGSSSGTANVTLSGAGTPFSLGTQPSLTVAGTVVNPTTITFTSPISGVLADLNADVTVKFATNASATSAAALLIKTPTVVASSLASVPSEIPTLITITGTGFAGGTPTVRFVAAAGTPFSGGTASTVDGTGVTLINPTTITVTTPRAGVGVSAGAEIQVLLTGGLTPISAGTLITFEPPTVTSLSPTMVDSEIPQVVTITGTGFGSSSGTANVTLSGAGTPFSGNTQPSLTVLGTVVNPTTITFTSPIAGVSADLNADVTLTFPTLASTTALAALLIKAPI